MQGGGGGGGPHPDESSPAAGDAPGHGQVWGGHVRGRHVHVVGHVPGAPVQPPPPAAGPTPRPVRAAPPLLQQAHRGRRAARWAEEAPS